MSLSKWIRHLTGSLPTVTEADKLGRYIIRLNDTHCYSYFLLHQLLEQLHVIGIIHTGGLSASINIKHSGHLLLTYEEHLNNLATLCQKYEIRKLWIRPKDQDHLPSIKRILPMGMVIKDECLIDTHGFQFSIVENELLLDEERGEFNCQTIELWRLRQLMHGVKLKSQIDLINIDKRKIISYSLPF